MPGSWDDNGRDVSEEFVRKTEPSRNPEIITHLSELVMPVRIRHASDERDDGNVNLSAKGVLLRRSTLSRK